MTQKTHQLFIQVSLPVVSNWIGPERRRYLRLLLRLDIRRPVACNDPNPGSIAISKWTRFLSSSCWIDERISMPRVLSDVYCRVLSDIDASYIVRCVIFFEYLFMISYLKGMNPWNWLIKQNINENDLRLLSQNGIWSILSRIQSLEIKKTLLDAISIGFLSMVWGCNVKCSNCSDFKFEQCFAKNSSRSGL